MKKLFLGITTLSLSLFCSAPLWAAPVTPPKPAKNVETRITSDQLTYLAEKQLVIFDKNVHVVRPDIEIWADRITVYLKPPKGDAQKKDGENTVTGETIKYFTEENRSEVMGGSKKRVEAVFSGSKNSSPIRGNR